MALSQILAFFSLLGFVALVGQASWKTFGRSRPSKSPRDYSLEELPEVLGFALRSCFNDGFVVIEAEGTELFVQFKKYILRDGTYGLELGFPDAEWSTVFAPKLRQALETAGIAFREQPEQVGLVRSFILVDCQQSIDLANRVTRLCFLEIFGLQEDARFRAQVTDHAPKGQEIDDPDIDEDTIKRESAMSFLAKHGIGKVEISLMSLGAIAVVGILVCYPLLWLATFGSHGDDATWAASMAGFSLTGSNEALALLIVFCLLVFAMDWSWRRLSQRHKMREMTAIDKLFRPLAFNLLPIAVVLSWLGW